MEIQMTINGLKVVDAKRPVVVTIAPRDINTGRNKAPQSCAAAKGALHSIPNCIEARVHLSRVYLKRKDRDVWERYQTGGALRGEILAFDRGGRFEPGDYELIPPTKPARAKRSGSETNRNSKRNHVRKPRKKLHVAQGVRHRMGARGTED